MELSKIVTIHRNDDKTKKNINYVSLFSITLDTEVSPISVSIVSVRSTSIVCSRRCADDSVGRLGFKQGQSTVNEDLMEADFHQTLGLTRHALGKDRT